MKILNTPVWVDVEVEGETTGMTYSGRFNVKPYLTQGEKADAIRLAEKYCRGIEQNGEQRLLLVALAFLKFYIIESDCDWWDKDGMELLDNKPIFAISEEISKIQTPKKSKDESPK